MPAGVGSDQFGEYEPQFARTGVERRVLGFVTDEDHLGLGARNTADLMARDMAGDINSPQVQPDPLGSVTRALQKLADAGLLTQREDGSYKLTDAGCAELRN